MVTTLQPAATLVLLRDGDNGLETLMLQRHSNASFLADHWVFPGGGVEQQDESGSAEETLRNAAVRETFEESGLAIDRQTVIPVSRWIAPPISPKRFDTWFFVARTNDDKVQLQASEIRDSRWLAPAEALALHYQQRLPTLPPAIVTLTQLAQFTESEAVIAHYSRSETVCFAPKACFWQDQLVMLYAEDAGYASGKADVPGTLHRCIQQEGCWHYRNTTGNLL